VWKFDVVTGRSSLIIQDPSMEDPANKTQQACYGINGVRALINQVWGREIVRDAGKLSFSKH
jgi:hypothetical protein